jgi:hypothetical protein
MRMMLTLAARWGGVDRESGEVSGWRSQAFKLWVP